MTGNGVDPLFELTTKERKRLDWIERAIDGMSRA
jgi:hypothetical protein